MRIKQEGLGKKSNNTSSLLQWVAMVRWRRLLAMGAPDSPVRHPAVRSLSWSTVGDFVLMWHRTVRCHTGQSGAPSDRCSDFCRDTIHPSESTVARR
jgi:hypothetical protein